MHFTRFGIFLNFLETKYCTQELFVPGHFDPEPLTRGARGATLEARLAWSAGALPSPIGSLPPATAGHGGQLGMG
jgi:hypothetical protein